MSFSSWMAEQKAHVHSRKCRSAITMGEQGCYCGEWWRDPIPSLGEQLNWQEVFEAVLLEPWSLVEYFQCPEESLRRRLEDWGGFLCFSNGQCPTNPALWWALAGFGGLCSWCSFLGPEWAVRTLSSRNQGSSLTAHPYFWLLRGWHQPPPTEVSSLLWWDFKREHSFSSHFGSQTFKDIFFRSLADLRDNGTETTTMNTQYAKIVWKSHPWMTLALNKQKTSNLWDVEICDFQGYHIIILGMSRLKETNKYTNNRAYILVW